MPTIFDVQNWVKLLLKQEFGADKKKKREQDSVHVEHSSRSMFPKHSHKSHYYNVSNAHTLH